MARKLQVLVPEKKDAYSRIRLFMSNQESGVVLTAEEEKKLDRLIIANSLLSERKHSREEVAEKIKQKFGVSIWTARNDINLAYSLFSNVTEDYKKYTLHHHVEDIDRMIAEWSLDKTLIGLVPKLLEAKTKAIAAMPTTVEAPDVPAPVLIVNVTQNIVSDISASDAMIEADKLIEIERQHDYLAFDEERTDE
jgi:hypothetical protein